ncbi:MAG: dihydroneopterin aldolase [Bacteroidota bacterium]|nr:dihydroneopterin aldolase [Bacteroidota bacterium]MDP4225465.1 dihydroneopterin aldolase [Bacteroidota bacterium]
MGLIQLEGMEFYAFHGCFKEERIVGNHFMVNVTLETDMSTAAKTDNIEDALNYQKVYEIVKSEMAVKSKLLENVANRIINALYDKFPAIEKCTVKVSKINPPIGGKMEKVSICLTRCAKN